MSTEITDAGQLRAARSLHERAKTRRIAKVLPDQASRFTISRGDDDEDAQTYFVRGGEAIWSDVATNSTFYVTLEDQGVQLTFIVLGKDILLSKKPLPGMDRPNLGAHKNRRPTYSSASS